MPPAPVNLLAGLAPLRDGERTDELARGHDTRIQRIVSHGHSSPPDFWYDQEEAEWVMVVEGSAALRFEGDTEPRVLKRGDWIDIPAHCRHRVEWTDPAGPTIWLAVHYR